MSETGSDPNEVKIGYLPCPGKIVLINYQYMYYKVSGIIQGERE